MANEEKVIKKETSLVQLVIVRDLRLASVTGFFKIKI